MKLIKPAIVAATATILSSTSVSAATLGTPSFTTTPDTIFIVNEFGTFGRVLDVPFAPFDTYTISLNTTVASSHGLPGLVGETLAFTFQVNAGFFSMSSFSLEIGGTEVLVDPLLAVDSFLFFPPIESEMPSATPGQSIFTYAAPFADFGPRDADFPEFEIGFQINQPLPLRTGYEQCNALNECEFSSDAPLTEINGQPIVESVSYSYVEGQIEGGTITFFTPGGPPPATVPLPAGGVLLLSALGAGVLMRNKRG